MEQAARAAGVADVGADLVTSPTRDLEVGTSFYRKRSSSRVSIPLSHRRSFSSTNRSRATSIANERISNADGNVSVNDIGKSTRTGEPGEEWEDDDEEEEEEMPWGPEHPCFPHLNPYVSKTSPLYESTRIVRIKRDWLIAGDLAPTFTNIYPEVFDPLIPEARFRELVNHINKNLIVAFDPYRKRNWVDLGIGALTGWLWDDLGLSQTKRDLSALEQWILDWNKDFGNTDGVQVIPLRRSGYLSIDIQIPDPKLDLEADDIVSHAGTEYLRGRADKISVAERSSSLGRAASFSSSRVGRTTNPMKPRDDKAYGAYPIVPPIPNKFLNQKNHYDNSVPDESL